MLSRPVSPDAKPHPPSRRVLSTFLLAVLFSCLLGRICVADTYTLIQNQQLAFGLLQQPSSGSQTFTVSPAGATSGTGTLLYGIPSNGDWTIKCTGTCTGSISFNIYAVSVNCPGVSSIGSFQVNYNNGEYSGPLPAGGLSNPGGGKHLKLGATAAYTSSVNAGTCSPTLFFAVAGSPNGGATASIGFDAAITLTKNSDINFGTVRAGVADTYTITTGAVVTAAGPGSYLGGATAAGNITIAGSTSQLVNVSAGGFTANGGVTPQNATCSYNGGAAGSCTITGAAAPGAGKTLLLGVDAVVDGTQAAGATAAPTFTMTVVYQ